MKNVRKWKEVDGTPIYVWTGGVPTERQIADAPMFTIFPGAVAVADALPSESELLTFKDPGYDDVEEPVWFISEISGSDRFTTMIPQVFPVVEKAGIMPPQQLFYEPQHNGDLGGQTFKFRGKQIKLKGDPQITPYAIEAGWTLIKAPDALGSKYYSEYVLDELHEDKKRWWFSQTPLRATLLGAGGGANDPKLLAKVNRYRRSIGHTHDLRPGEWSDDDIRELLSHAPSRYRNPGSTQDPDALQQFLEEKTRQIVEAAREGWDEDDIEDLEAERDAVLQELSMAGPEYARRAKDAIERIEAKPNPSGLEQLKRKLMR